MTVQDQQKTCVFEYNLHVNAHACAQEKSMQSENNHVQLSKHEANTLKNICKPYPRCGLNSGPANGPTTSSAKAPLKALITQNVCRPNQWQNDQHMPDVRVESA